MNTAFHSARENRAGSWAEPEPAQEGSLCPLAGHAGPSFLGGTSGCTGAAGLHWCLLHLCFSHTALVGWAGHGEGVGDSQVPLHRTRRAGTATDRAWTGGMLNRWPVLWPQAVPQEG